MKVKKWETELPAGALKRMQISEWDEASTPLYKQALEQHHYLGCPDGRQMKLCQVVSYEGQAVGLFVWTLAARALIKRDGWIGWDARTKTRRLGFVIQCNRFLLLTKPGDRNVASRVLTLSSDHIAQAWEQRYALRPLLAETFVDPERFSGGCYQAAGWYYAEQTAGFERKSGGDYYVEHGQPKDLWLKCLDPQAREKLRRIDKRLEGEKKRAPSALPVSIKVAQSLRAALQEVPDHRTRKARQYPLSAMLATCILAMACGESTVIAIFRFCQDLNGKQRRALGFRSKANGVVPPPGESCWRQVLSKVDSQALARALSKWQQGQGQALPPILAIDGKVVSKNLATLVSLVDVRDGQPIAQAAASGVGQELELTRELIAALPEAALDGVTVMGDALYAQKQIVSELVQARGADVIMQLKDNQPGVNKRVTHLLETQAPPFCAQPQV